MKKNILKIYGVVGLSASMVMGFAPSALAQLAGFSIISGLSSGGSTSSSGASTTGTVDGGLVGGSSSGEEVDGSSSAPVGGVEEGSAIQCSSPLRSDLVTAQRRLNSVQAAYDNALKAFQASTAASIRAVNVASVDTRDFVCEQAATKSVTAMVQDKIAGLAAVTDTSAGPLVVQIPNCASGSANVSASGTQLSWSCDAVTGQAAPAVNVLQIPKNGVAVIAGPTSFSSVSVNKVSRPIGLYTLSNMTIDGMITTQSGTTSTASCTSMSNASCVSAMTNVLTKNPTASVTLSSAQNISIKSAGSVALANGNIINSLSTVGSNSTSEPPIGGVINANLVAPLISVDASASATSAGHLVIAGTVWGNVETTAVASANGTCTSSGMDPIIIPFSTSDSTCLQGDVKCTPGLGVETGGRTWVLLNSTEGGAGGVLAANGGGGPGSGSGGSHGSSANTGAGAHN